uniref:Inositol-1,4,5-trisphosphate 5-phosphatase n=1 Tax=Cannabis sativa TaxID=3483 RepID=A0A803PIN5_CANSA
MGIWILILKRQRSPIHLVWRTNKPTKPIMASSSSLLFESILTPLLLLTTFFPSSSSLAGAVNPPFHPRDVLPLLPRQLSWPILNSLHSAVDLLPTFVGAASVSALSSNHTLDWKGACFYENSAWVEFHNKSGSEFGGGTLHIKMSKAHSWTCMDIYVFATPYRVTWDYYFLAREHTLEFEAWEGKAEFEYVKQKGVSIFLMQAGMLGTLQALWEVFPLFTNTGWGENSNLAFLKKHMGATFEQRPQPWVTNITVDDIHSGDFLAISKIRGRWGGFESLEKWVTGSYAGHTAVCLRDSEGKLWVGESGHENEEGEDIIAVLPWDEWWDFELNKDDSNPQIALLPLHPDIRAKFNETAAWEYARSMDGKPYGYHNMIFSWIDTIEGNYPPPLDAHLVASVMTVWNQMQPAYAANLWNEALNKRLGTQGLDLPNILVETEKRGSSFDELLTIPEQDDWLYSDGKSTSCVAFILEMYKEAGLFDPISSSIEVTEFTIKDAYILKFFEDDPNRLPKWCNDGDTVKLPFCQIRGKYRMELPGYNTVEPYPHMNERCPSLPPKYSRSLNC